MGTQDQISLAKEKHHELRLGWRRLATDLAQIIRDLGLLREQVNEWLKTTHPELLKDDSKQS